MVPVMLRIPAAVILLILSYHLSKTGSTWSPIRSVFFLSPNQEVASSSLVGPATPWPEALTGLSPLMG
jgi:hypothetical protein